MGCSRIGLFVILVVTLIQVQVKGNDELVQVSTINALLGGIYDGEVKIGQLLKFEISDWELLAALMEKWLFWMVSVIR